MVEYSCLAHSQSFLDGRKNRKGKPLLRLYLEKTDLKEHRRHPALQPRHGNEVAKHRRQPPTTKWTKSPAVNSRKTRALNRKLPKPATQNPATKVRNSKHPLPPIQCQVARNLRRTKIALGRDSHKGQLHHQPRLWTVMSTGILRAKAWRTLMTFCHMTTTRMTRSHHTLCFPTNPYLSWSKPSSLGVA